MDYRKLGNKYYIRLDRGEEIMSSLLEICRIEGIASATYMGIGGCQSADIQTFMPALGKFSTEHVEGMLELISFMGNIITDEAGKLYYHTHAIYALEENGQQRVVAGHIKASTVLYTAEIELNPVEGGVIMRQPDPETGTGFWSFQEIE
ncbi:MAG: DUF296 domain-containing protein [bacterium]|nr:DUF296 domain-containing protein [bacterium]